MIQQDITSFGIEIKVDPNYSGDGAGINLFNDLIIYSSGHTFYRDILSTIVSITLFYGYFTVKPINPTLRIRRAHTIWKIVSVSFILISLFDSWLWRFSNISPDVANIFLVTGAVGVVAVSIFYPEAVLLSHSQIYRISSLYDLIEKLSSSPKSTVTRELIDYLETLPEAIDNL